MPKFRATDGTKRIYTEGGPDGTKAPRRIFEKGKAILLHPKEIDGKMIYPKYVMDEKTGKGEIVYPKTKKAGRKVQPHVKKGGGKS